MGKRRSSSEGSTDTRLASKGGAQNLTIRLDPKTRFFLEFVSRLTDRSMTKVIERAIKREADETEVQPVRPQGMKPMTWRDYWHTSEAVRRVTMLIVPPFDTTYEDDILREFILAHREFFVEVSKLEQPDTGLPVSVERVEVLWPRISILVDLWKSTKATDPEAATRAMVDYLREAGVGAPDRSTGTTSTGTRSVTHSDGKAVGRTSKRRPKEGS